MRRTFINARHPEIDKVLCAIKEAGIICDNLHSEYSGTFNGESVSMDDVSREGPAGDYRMHLNSPEAFVIFRKKPTARQAHRRSVSLVLQRCLRIYRNIII